MADSYDVAIIGGGHNGLISAAYLAKAGRKVVVLEKKAIVGGVAVTEELFPEFKASSLIDGSDTLHPKIVADLNLEQFGLTILPTEPFIFAPQKNDKPLTIWHDIERTSKEIAAFSKPDAKAYPQFIKKMNKIAKILAQINVMALPDMPDAGFADILGALKLIKPVWSLGWKNVTHMARMLSLSVSDLLNEWFESDFVKATIAASALNTISLGPQESGTAFAFIQNFSTSNNGLFRPSGQIKGGIGALGNALEAAAKSNGAKILTQAEVMKINIKRRKHNQIQMADGKIITARTIISAIDMRSTFFNLIDPVALKKSVIKKIKNITYNGTMARVHFALDTLPNFTANKDSAQQLLAGHIQIAPSMNDLQKAFDPVKYGQFTDAPYLDIRIPTLNDKSLAPEGKHLMSVTVKYIPYRLREGDWEDLRETLGQLVIKTINDYAPDFNACIHQTYVITPKDMETHYDLPEGSLLHGDTRLDQALWMRPIPGYAKYNSPIKGLYLCGAATHPGVALTGINGANAAHIILKREH